jgi:hypothetical protein
VPRSRALFSVTPCQTHIVRLAPNSRVCGGGQVVTEFEEDQLPVVLDALERMDHHLTAAVVSNDVAFQHKVRAPPPHDATFIQPTSTAYTRSRGLQPQEGMRAVISSNRVLKGLGKSRGTAVSSLTALTPSTSP